MANSSNIERREWQEMINTRFLLTTVLVAYGQLIEVIPSEIPGFWLEYAFNVTFNNQEYSAKIRTNNITSFQRDEFLILPNAPKILAVLEREMTINVAGRSALLHADQKEFDCEIDPVLNTAIKYLKNKAPVRENWHAVDFT